MVGKKLALHCMGEVAAAAWCNAYVAVEQMLRASSLRQAQLLQAGKHWWHQQKPADYKLRHELLLQHSLRISLDCTNSHDERICEAAGAGEQQLLPHGRQLQQQQQQHCPTGSMLHMRRPVAAQCLELFASSQWCIAPPASAVVAAAPVVSTAGFSAT
jgi:hypothetical protein